MPSFFPVPSKASLKPPPAPSRKPSQRLVRPPKELDEFISSDLEMSFASTMSLNSAPASPLRNVNDDLDACDFQNSPMAMDISPAPPSKLSFNVTSSDDEEWGCPRAVRVARSFGRELSNHETASNTDALSSMKGGKGLQRSPLPAEWAGAFPRPKEVPHQPPPVYDAADSSDAMDVDDCILPASLTRPDLDEQTVKISTVPTYTGYSEFFFSPERPSKHAHSRTRRSLSPEGSPRQDVIYRPRPSNESEVFLPAFEELSSPAPSSPSVRKLERFASTGGGLFGRSSKPSPPPFPRMQTDTFSSLGDSKHPKRPTISALVHHEGRAQSAYSILDSKTNKGSDPAASPVARRAFSATVAPMPTSPSSDYESEGPEFSSPAAQAFAKRQTMRTIRRRDGTDDFRGVGMLRQHDVSPLRTPAASITTESPSSRWLTGAGLPGFGDNEAHGKILPCEKVSEDGLMRIDVQTLDAILSGKYDNKIASYRVIDCRFDYEYQGGHIKGAVNINTTAEIEEFLLGTSVPKPSPSCSGDPVKKTILVFHCEFSAKRAPTFAKHLRSRDRAMNNHVYPRVHYPEVYILKGGYCQYFSDSGIYCEPRGYVRMDDPQFARDCRQDLDHFRNKTRFGRTKSYAFGESKGSSSQSQHSHHQGSHHQRNSAPSAGPATSLFSAANAARSRRAGPIGENTAPRLLTLDEDANTSMVSSDDSVLEGVDRSPCPLPTAKSSKPGSMGMAMLGTRRNCASTGRGPVQRTQTFA